MHWKCVYCTTKPTFFILFISFLSYAHAGTLYDATGYYPNSFYLGGGVMVAASIVMIPVVIFLKKEDFPGRAPEPQSNECIEAGITMLGSVLLLPPLISTSNEDKDNKVKSCSEAWIYKEKQSQSKFPCSVRKNCKYAGNIFNYDTKGTDLQQCIKWLFVCNQV